jgi:uncharacterized membrane protein YphA (DoxX/SURF4 family)
MTTSTTGTEPAATPAGGSPGRARGVDAVRIAFGAVWAVDAIFKWLPGFVHGQTLDKELGSAAKIGTPVVYQWIGLWHAVGTAAPAAFAVGVAVVETLIALGLLLGAVSRLVLLGSAVFSFGIWSAAEGFHLPWTRPGSTDLGPSVAYVVASLALYAAGAGATWSVDGRLLPRLGRLGVLCAPPR